MLSASTLLELEAKLRRFEEETSNQVVVVTFPRLEGEVLEEFSIRLAEQWKIGQKGKDNGVILLIFKDDRQVRIESGYGLEGALPDATAKLIIENEIVPRFREGKYEDGIEKALEAMMAATRGEYQAERRERGEGMENYAAFFVWSVILGAFFSLVLLGILFAVGLPLTLLGLVYGHYLIAALGCFLGILPLLFYFLLGRHRRGHSVLSSHGSGWHSGGIGSGGWGGGSSWGGGFSGGGGSFGGGGASGRW